MPNIQQHQSQDQLLMQRAQRDAQHYQIETIDKQLIITYRIDPARQDDWRIYLPLSLVDDVITWYNLVLGHRGKTSMYATITKRFYSPGLKQRIERFNCEICQLNKAGNVQYGQLPERHADLVPWFPVAVDLIGPWKIYVNGRELEFNALTCIDPVTNLTELAFIENKLPHTWQTCSKCCGCHDIRDRTNVFTIKEANSLAKPFERNLLLGGSMMAEPLARMRLQMRPVNECI